MNNLKKDSLLEFLNHELELSYERNKEVLGYQKGTMNLLFGFYGLILGAIVFKGEDSGQYLDQLNSFKYLMPFLVLLVGLAFSMMYLNYEVYSRIYKACMRECEDAIYEVLFHGVSNLKKYKITYYAHPKGHPKFAKPALGLGATVIFEIFAEIIMNLGVVALVLRLVLNAPLQQTVWWIIVSLSIHIVIVDCFYFYQRKKYGVYSKETTSGDVKVLKFTLLVGAIILLIYGLGFLFVPSLLVSFSRGNYVDLSWLRWSGGVILALGIGTLMVYNNPKKQGIFVTTMTLATLFIGLGLLYSWIMQEFSGVTWFIALPTCLALALSGLFFWGRNKAIGIL